MWRARRVRGLTSFKGFPLYLSIYRWPGSPFASKLSLAIKTMTRVTSGLVLHPQALTIGWAVELLRLVPAGLRAD